MKKRNSRLFFQDMLDCIEKIEKYTKDISYQKFINNEIIIDAVVRNFEIIGEAARHIPDSYKLKYKELPLTEMVGMRNILIHNYLGINYSFLWKTIQDDLPKVKKIITEIIRKI